MKNTLRNLILSLLIGATGLACQTRITENTSLSSARVDAPLQSCALWLETEQLCAALEWTHLPDAHQADGELQVRFYRDQKLQDPDQLPFVKLWMQMGKMGHGSDPVNLERESAGRYRARGVNFRMAGKWQVWLQLRDRTTAKEVKDQARQDVQIR